MIAPRVAAGFARQGFAAHLGLELEFADAGRCVIGCNFAPGLTQHMGMFHAGVLTTMADNACGFAALTLMPEGRDVVSVEFKVNFLRPARGWRARAMGTVLKPGRTLSICRADVEVLDDAGNATLAATMLATMMAVE